MLWAVLLAASACAHHQQPRPEPRHTCDDFTESGIFRDAGSNDVVLYAREESNHCGDRLLVTQIPIARIKTRARTAECPIGDELVRHWKGEAYVEAPYVWGRLVPRLQQELRFPVQPGKRAAVIVGCPAPGQVDLLWVDVTDIRAPTAWLTRPEANSGDPTSLLYARAPQLPVTHEPADQVPPPEPETSAGSTEGPAEGASDGTSDGVSVVAPSCDLGPTPSGATRWIGRELGLTDLPGPFTKRTKVLDIRGRHGALREFEESAPSRGQPLQWKCTGEKRYPGEVVQEREWLTIRFSADGGGLRCEILELAVAEASAMWRDGGPGVEEGCQDWRWAPRPTAKSKVLVCNERSFFASAPGVERTYSDNDCDSGAHRLRKIASDGRVFPYYPKR